MGFPGGTSGKGLTCQCKRHKRQWFDPWVRKIPWRRAWQTTPVFLPEESPQTKEPGGLQVHGMAESDTTERLSTAQPILGLFTKHRELYLLSIEKPLNESVLFILSPYCQRE